MTVRRARLFFCCLSLVRAWPLPFTKRDDPRPSVPASIYTPTVVIFVVFVGLTALGFLCRAFRRHSRATQIANASAAANRTVTGTGTAADQLTSAINADVAGSGSNTAPNPTRAPRRNRRPRRTPSQVSVTSLPEYMKEPGENELVIGQTPARTHTLTIPILHHQPTTTAVVDHPSDDEDARTMTRTRSSRYYPIPTSANTMPLLHQPAHEQDQEQPPERGRDRNSNDNNDTNDDISLQDLSQPRQRAGPSTSINTESANTHTQSLSPTSISSLPLDPAPPPPPAYFEVVADDDMPLSVHPYYPPHPSSSRFSILSASTSTFSTSNAPLLGHNVSSSTSMLPEPARTNNRNRQSGFRTFLNRVSMSMPIGGGGPSNSVGGHQRNESSISNTSTTSFFRRPGSSLSSISLAINQNQTHHTRQNPSISQSRASLLSSPSTVSINSLSISAPLTHTASRTQFIFPQSAATTATTTATKTGAAMMTPEQIKVIAAREAIGRFGVPYGPDAVAFAAARVGPPPPGFQEVEGEGSGSRLDADDAVEEQRGEETGGGHGARDESSASASSTATVTPGSGPSEIGVGMNFVQGNTRDSMLEPKLNDPSISSGSSPHINGVSTSPSPSTCASPLTPTPVSTSEFGTLSSKLLSPNDNNILRSGSISSNYSSQTYATAAESLMSVSLSVPLTTTTSSNSTSRSSSYSAAGGGEVDVVRGWSSSEEGDGDERGVIDEFGSVTPRIARLGLDQGPDRGLVNEVEV